MIVAGNATSRVSREGKRNHSRILTALREEFARSGRGSITRVEHELGLYSGFFRKSRRTGSLTVHTLTETLAALGVPPDDFFARAFPKDLEEEKL